MDTDGRRRQVIFEQLTELLEFLKEHQDLAKGLTRGRRGKFHTLKIWNLCAKKLNAVKDGAVKDGKGWSKYWCDWKYRVRRRALELKAAKENNRPPPDGIVPLSALEETILSLIGVNAVEGVIIKSDPLADRSERSRISIAQRGLMLDFIKNNPGVVTGRAEGPDGARVRASLLAEMANILNSAGTGTTKTPEKWLRSWQDWKSDVKKKAASLTRYTRGTGAAPPKPDLTDLEQDLIQFIGQTCISGMGMPDPLDDAVSEPTPTTSRNTLRSPSSPATVPVYAILDEVPESHRKKRSSVDDRLVAAMERQAEASYEIARQIGRLADAAGEIINHISNL